jgi:integrase
MARTKVIRKTESGNIIKLANGRFRIDCVDSFGKRYRPAFATIVEAERALERIAERKRAGEFLASAATVTFDEALDLLLARNDREGLAKASRDRARSVVRSHLRPVFGARKLSEFSDQRMRFVQAWFDHRAQHAGAASQTLGHIRSAMKLSFDEAIKAGLMSPPNPVSEFNLRVPKGARRFEREVLTLQEISDLMRASLRRADKEHELVYRVRFMLVILGLLTGMRPGECSGLCWDCVDFDSRKIFVRRTVQKAGVGWELVNTTKTGKSGFRSIPMSPVLHAALGAYRDRLITLGRKIDGPVLVTNRANIVRPDSITGHHWPAISAKAGFVDAHGGLRHTDYALRHTAANLWRTVGIPIDRLQILMGHTTIQTTAKHYLHETPHFEVLRREVAQLGLDTTPEGYIDGLGYILFRRWRIDDIDVECAPPRLTTIGANSSALIASPKAIVIDIKPDVIVAKVDPPLSVITTAAQLRKWQRTKAKEMFLAGSTKQDITAELGISIITLTNWLRLADVDNVRLGRLPAIERRELMDRIKQYREQHPDASSTAIARALGIEPKRVTMYERRRGAAMPHRPGAHKIGKFAADIERLSKQGLSQKQMAAELERIYPERKTPSHSGIGYYMSKVGLKTQRWKSGRARIGTFETQIREMVAAGKSAGEIARKLSGVSRSGISGYLKRINSQEVSDNSEDRPSNELGDRS